ncbi:hypothetical protein D8779_08445 [Pseudomonas leptonychotis]|uniref:Uncharacterized protein n=1 Tax=Pseudomonas leptonychotis TaxID=2448482 RepID=A0A4T2A118_9PSED|nr:hypothetical protein D8779_08445 [Pseudomonas leptonychotis]
MPSSWSRKCANRLLKTTYVGNPALKTASKCSFTTVNSAFSAVFALSCRPRLRFQLPVRTYFRTCAARPGSQPYHPHAGDAR